MSNSHGPHLAQIMSDNMMAKFAAFAERLPDFCVYRLAGIQYVDCGLQSDTFNTVFGWPTDVDDIETVTRHYREQGNPAAWWLSGSSPETEEKLQRAGWVHEEYDVGMYLEHLVPLPGQLSAHSRVEYCDTAERFQDFGRTLSSIFEPENPVEAENVRAIYLLAGEHREELPGDLIQIVGYADEEPVSVATVYLTGNVAGIFDIATPKHRRNRGFGTEIFQQALRVAHQRGASTCVLQASPDGLNIYRKQGFVPSGSFTVWNLPCQP
ncbi:GNAT family N-acetyltransferase [Streptomyces huasconensis]|uniref:GNAT family N-acetyltransferase n=1 Tax=Streptomyces huasconensis TaxID=1854574 RepID=UPI0033DAC1DA